MLLEALTWQTVEGNRYPLQAVAGWEDGFRDADYCLTGPYRWLDGEHLLLLPVVEREFIQEEMYSLTTQPVVVDLDSGAIFTVGEPQEACYLPAWSGALRQVIEVVGDEARLRDLEGRITAAYPGGLPLELSPSGLRLLAGETWIDLESGRVEPLPGWRAWGHNKPGWSADEQRVFGCCVYYADLASGERWNQPESVFPDFFIGGRGSWPGEELFSTSHWIGDDLAIVNTVAFWFFRPDPNFGTFIPVWQPDERSYIDLQSELELETPPMCSFQLAPGAKRLWLECTVQRQGQLYPEETAYLIDFPGLDVLTLPGEPQGLGWSAGGEYLVFTRLAGAGEALRESWLLTATGESRRLGELAAQSVTWHPTRPIGALRFEERNWVILFNAASGASNALSFEKAVIQLDWQPTGDGVVLLADDGVLWWLVDAFDANLQPVPVTPALADAHSVRWSPDGQRVAFVSGNALYVVDLN